MKNIFLASLLLLLPGCSVVGLSGPSAADQARLLAAAQNEAKLILEVVLEKKGSAYLKAKAPKVLEILDANQDGVLSLDEVQAVLTFDQALLDRLNKAMVELLVEKL